MTAPLFPRHKNNNYFITQTDIYKNLLIAHSFQQVIRSHNSQLSRFTQICRVLNRLTLGYNKRLQNRDVTVSPRYNRQ